jgi:hypothetical protein
MRLRLEEATVSTIGYLTTTIFDFGAIKSLPTELEALGIRRPLVVTDAGIQAAGIAAQVLTHLNPMTVSVFAGTPPNPTEEAVLWPQPTKGHWSITRQSVAVSARSLRRSRL